jgi:hypothetical protein
MAIDNIQPVHAINKYLWSRVGDEAGGEAVLLRDDYKGPGMTTGLIPIVPVKETPDLYTIIEAQDGIKTLPYIVYTWSRINHGGEWFMETHEIAYSIRSADSAKMGKLIKIFNLEFRDYDRAALRVNSYIQSNGSAAQKQFIFKHISVTSLGAEMPADTENGVDEAIVILSATFTDSYTAPA